MWRHRQNGGFCHSPPDAKVHLKWACCELLSDKASQLVLAVKNPPRRHKRCGFNPWIGKIPWRRSRQPIPVFLPRESPWTEKPGKLQSIGSQRVRHN